MLYYRYQVLLSFAFVYTDSDQTIMWGGLRDYANGNFYEPRFYGQAYNTFLEALLAVPLYKCGYAPYTALPFITSLLSILPFIVISAFTFFKRSAIASFIILTIPLLLPPEYAFITSMPRGFVTGVFIAGIACATVFYQSNKWSFLLAGFLSLFAFTVNSNAVLISMPCLLYLFLENRKNPVFYKFMGTGLILGGLIHLGMAYFYSSHPFYNLHKMTLEFSFQSLIASLSNLDVYLNYNMPVLWHQGYMVLFVFIAFGIFFLYKKEYSKAIPVLILPFFILATFGLNKVHEGTESIFFHFSRMYLALPVLLALCVSLINPGRRFFIYYAWVYIPYLYFTNQVKDLDASVAENVKPNGQEIVIVSKVEYILRDCKRLAEVCRANKVDLFVIANHFFMDPYAHGCAACESNFPKTLKPYYERRTWRLLEDENTVYNTVMFVDMNNHIADSCDFINKIPGTIDLYLVENNKLKTLKLLDSLKISYRQFR